jgi:hypothetical protein
MGIGLPQGCLHMQLQQLQPLRHHSLCQKTHSKPGMACLPLVGVFLGVVLLELLVEDISRDVM